MPDSRKQRSTGTVTAPSGIPGLDDALGGIYWGDNVVWEVEAGADVTPFYDAVAEQASAYDGPVYVTARRPSEEIRATYPLLDVVDARPGSRLAAPRPLLEALRARYAGRPRGLILFDPLESFGARWGFDVAARFFVSGCPLLLGLGAVAYWSFDPSRHAPGARAEIEGITQCVLSLDGETLRVRKAEGRPVGIEGSIYRYRIEAGRPVLAAAPAVARLGTALRALRRERRLSQADLALLAGVSPSAISQVERGRRGLSLETLLDLSSRLHVTLDELLRGEVAPGYRIARRDDPRRNAVGVPVPLLDDPHLGLRTYFVRLAPGESAAPGFAHKGVEVVAVASGLVQVQLDTGRPVLRSGEALVAETSGVAGWRNLGDAEATLFWMLHDA